MTTADRAGTPATSDLERRDRAARERALDVTGSFLVQAPAGSGKTGLLIQRFLALLAHIDRPERIVAMTFTRKAASEMRERVLMALRDAAAGTPVDASHAHDLVTRRLALAALAQDARHGWQLTAHPARLRMLTIDALAAALARAAPLASGLGMLPAFVDDAMPLYVAAARETLAGASAADPAWRRFLAHVDNDADAAVALLATLLARRDQWMRLRIDGGGGDLRAALERSLRREIDEALARLRALFPGALARRLSDLARYAADTLRSAPDAVVEADALAALADADGAPDATPEGLRVWRTLADWVLVGGKPQFRERVDTNCGFPPKASGKGASMRALQKVQFVAWLDEARAIPGLAAAIHRARQLPPPRYDDAAWAFVEATLALLPHVAAGLIAVFAREGAADFSEATLRALAALGDADDPGDLLLALDFRIAHLLVDEFQDTSLAQLDLIAKLTAGWTEGDGRTLFAVGDPMQSIYRFREAEVAIFVEAQARARIAAVAVENLELACNFRSLRPLVTWVNTVFPQVLPAASDPARGEVAYHPVQATRGDERDAAPTLDLVPDLAAEAALVVQRIREAQAAGSDDIAILVRARTHLDAILPALRREAISFAAVELESLSEGLATRDLASLTRALTQPMDRLAALALLRAPWCGLALADLLVLAEAAEGRALLDAAADSAIAARLSDDARARIARLLDALAPARTACGRGALGQCVRAAWLALGGPAYGNGPLDLAGAERFFPLVAAHERAGDLPDWPAFADAAARLYADADASAAGVKVMTLHKAKGLEFDTVILPGLARLTGNGEDTALRWKVRQRDGEPALMLAPLRAREGARALPDPLYAYLKALDADEEAAELGRLLYVGCTRAKHRLHLIAAPGIAATKDGERRWIAPRKRSALARLWPALAESGAAPDADSVSADEADGESGMAPEAPPLVRLSLAWSPPPLPAPLPRVAVATEASTARPVFQWAHPSAAAVGTVAHRLFAQIAREGLAQWDAMRLAAAGPRIRVELAGENVDAADLEPAAAQVEAAVRNLLADARGRWLCASEHAEAASEWALAGVDGDAVVHVVLDRTFVADGVRWIVDFKTGGHEGADVDEFLAREVLRYRGQLERYARLVGARDARPIRLALYYPLLRGWREWAHQR